MENVVFGIVLMVLMVSGVQVQGADPDLVTDFDPPANVNASAVDGNFFTFTGFRGLGWENGKNSFKVSKASAVEFPGLSGLGVSYALLQFQPESVNPPHIHPRGTELLFLLDGSLTVAFVDTTNKLFKQTLYKGDLFVFPKGLVHYQINLDNYKTALAISAFGSANPGTVSLPSTLFGSGISDIVLTTSFKISPSALAELKAPFNN